MSALLGGWPRAARVGEPVTPELLAAYSTLLLYAANMTGVRIEELRPRHLLAQITARFAWPHPLRRSTDWPARSSRVGVTEARAQ